MLADAVVVLVYSRLLSLITSLSRAQRDASVAARGGVRVTSAWNFGPRHDLSRFSGDRVFCSDD